MKITEDLDNRFGCKWIQRNDLVSSCT